MKLTFVSNYINHHQIPFSEACFRALGTDYAFIQTSPMEAERLAMGWRSDGESRPYVYCLYEREEECLKLILESDVLLAGWTDREDLIGERLQRGKLTLRISERLYREGQWKAISPKGLLRKYKDHIRYRKKPVYLLCAGAYVASDFHLIGAYPGKMFQWGYFPETVFHGEELWREKKKENSVQIVWAGRFISLKHPEFMIKLANDLKQSPIPFHIHLAGSGEMEPKLRQLAHSYQVTDQITFHGFCSPEQVRKLMESSHIHVFTSNHLEGWGAVVNEAMNSGCAEVASGLAGAVPFLIEQGKNGIVFPEGSYEGMLEAVKFLMAHPEERERMGRNAYQTITGLWNAERAAAELLRFLEDLQAGEVKPAKAGPLSTAPVIRPGRQYRKGKQPMDQEWSRGKGEA